MTKDDELLDEARQYCDANTGEVLRRIPEELMQKLRKAKLARGIPGKASKHTDSYATWYVFLNSDIRADVMNAWRVACAAKKQKGRAAAEAAKAQSRSTGKSGRSGNQGMKKLVERRKPRP